MYSCQIGCCVTICKPELRFRSQQIRLRHVSTLLLAPNRAPVFRCRTEQPSRRDRVRPDAGEALLHHTDQTDAVAANAYSASR